MGNQDSALFAPHGRDFPSDAQHVTAACSLRIFPRAEAEAQPDKVSMWQHLWTGAAIMSGLL